MSCSKITLTNLAFCLVVFPFFCRNSHAAAGDQTSVLQSAVSVGLHQLDLPAYDYQIDNGLYATITAFSSIEKANLNKEDQVNLKSIKGFKKDLAVTVVWQNKPAPLAVLLLGLGTRANSRMAQHWKMNMYEAGCHVMTFDSVFLPSFSERSGHGVAGNLVEESKLVVQIIETFLKHNRVKDRVTKVGLIGGSYGGVLGLQVARLVAKEKREIPLERVLSFSPPVNMKTAATLLDKYHKEDRWNFTLVELGGEMLGHKPVGKGEKIPFTQSEMRAGIAAAFRLDLTEVVERNDKQYRLGKLPVADEEDGNSYRMDVAETWTFKRFIEEMAVPYWKEKGVVQSEEEFWAAGRLVDLVNDCPDYVHVVIAEDDPLNKPEELDELRSAAPDSILTILPRGGHMGFMDTEWAKARMQKMFE